MAIFPDSCRRILAGWLAAASLALAAAPEEGRPLFDGRDLQGWETYLAQPHRTVSFPGERRDASGEHLGPVGTDRDPTGVFSVAQIDGGPAIHISGQIFGALITRKEFENYHLRVEMRWGERKWPPRLDKPRDGGVLYHAFGLHPSARAWLSSLEFQVQENDFGDLFAIDTRVTAHARRSGPKLQIYDASGPAVLVTDAPHLRRLVRQANFEKPPGEWNVLEVVCLGDKSWHLVNGHVVMRLESIQRPVNGQWIPLTRGKIQLQSEGSEYFIRKVEIQGISSWREDSSPEAKNQL